MKTDHDVYHMQTLPQSKDDFSIILSHTDIGWLWIRRCVVITLHLGWPWSTYSGGLCRYTLNDDHSTGHGDTCTQDAPHSGYVVWKWKEVLKSDKFQHVNILINKIMFYRKSVIGSNIHIDSVADKSKHCELLSKLIQSELNCFTVNYVLNKFCFRIATLFTIEQSECVYTVTGLFNCSIIHVLCCIKYVSGKLPNCTCYQCIVFCFLNIYTGTCHLRCCTQFLSLFI